MNYKRWMIGLGMSCVAALTPALAVAKLSLADVQALVAHIEQTVYPDSSISSYRLTHFNKDAVLKSFSFEMTMKDNNSLLVMQWPATSKHKYLLKVGNNLWMYFSDVRRSIRLSAKDSFMGTDANNYDIMQISLLKDYTVGGFTETSLDGDPVVKVELIAKPATEGYAKIISWMSLRQQRMLQNECYSISGQLIKTIRYGEASDVGPYRIANSVRITSNVNKDRSTLMEVSKVQPKQADEIKNLIFTLGYLETMD